MELYGGQSQQMAEENSGSLPKHPEGWVGDTEKDPSGLVDHPENHPTSISRATPQVCDLVSSSNWDTT